MVLQSAPLHFDVPVHYAAPWLTSHILLIPQAQQCHASLCCACVLTRIDADPQMTGFFAATIGELITGKGALGQLALETNLPPGVIKVCELAHASGSLTVVHFSASGFSAKACLKQYAAHHLA